MITVYYRGIPYLLDLMVCRRALVQRQIDGELDSMESLAGAVGISRSTASRFFSGKPTSLAVTLEILKKLELSFDDAARPKSDGDDSSDSGGAVGAKLPDPPPHGGTGKASIRPHRADT